MSILTDLRAGKITWSQAASEVVAWGEKIIAGNPAMQAAVGAGVSDLKQAASLAVVEADTAFGAAIGPVTATLEAGLDGALAVYTKGISTPFNGLMNDTIEKVAAAAKAEADAWAMKAKAALATPAAQ